MTQFIYKMVIVIRKDLDMRCGKIAVQVGHGVVASLLMTQAGVKQSWIDEGQKKVVLKVNNLEKLIELEKKAIENNIMTSSIIDFGLTQVDPNTKTGMAFEITKEEVIDKITDGIPLL